MEEIKKPVGLDEDTGEIFTRIGQAKTFIKKQPIYYAPSGLWWFWNFDRYCYELKDETDLLNGIREEMKIDTVNSKDRAEILHALKQIGREQCPKDKPKGWIQFQDILVNPKTLDRIKASPKYFLTNPIPHKLGFSEETPELDKLLRQWVVKEGVQDESYVCGLYEYIAYALTDDLFMQRILALTGAGSNGKGTFLKVIQKLVGKESCIDVNIRKLSINNFATSSLYKKLVAFIGEVSYGDLKNTNILKKLSGEDALEYEFKGKNSFTDEITTTFFIASNALPRTPDRSLGFYRRWFITDFPNVFEIASDVISIIEEEEYENLCLKCVNTLKRLYEVRKFTNEGNYDEREKKYEERSNPLPVFIEENCEEVLGEAIRLQELTNHFNIWLKTKRLRIVSVRQVGKMLREEGYTVGKRIFDDPNTSYAVVTNLAFRPNNTNNTENE